MSVEKFYKKDDKIKQLRKLQGEVLKEEYFIDKHFDVIFALSFIIPPNAFVIMAFVTRNIGMSFLVTFLAVVIFFVIIIAGKIDFEDRKAERFEQLRKEIENFK